LVNLDHQAFKEYLENKDHLDLKAPKVTEVSLDYKACLDQLDLQEREVCLERMVKMESLEHLGLEDLLVWMELLVLWVMLDPWDQEVSRVRRVREVHQENWDLQDHLDHLVREVGLTWQLCLQ